MPPSRERIVRVQESMANAPFATGGGRSDARVSAISRRRTRTQTRARRISRSAIGRVGGRRTSQRCRRKKTSVPV
jgi:hypothetical protein